RFGQDDFSCITSANWKIKEDFIKGQNQNRGKQRGESQPASIQSTRREAKQTTQEEKKKR
ncbi:unnamed protein product, partial [Prunus brigantina]